MMSNTETGTCSICGGQYDRYGNNAWPINAGRCCNDCNQMVIAARMRNIALGRSRDDATIDTDDIDGQHRHLINPRSKQ